MKGSVAFRVFFYVKNFIRDNFFNVHGKTIEIVFGCVTIGQQCVMRKNF